MSFQKGDGTAINPEIQIPEATDNLAVDLTIDLLPQSSKLRIFDTTALRQYICSN
jgi:hypothetical protein